MDDPLYPPPPTAASAEKPLQPPAPPQDSVSAGKGVKETIESILIAFILAFVFRAFVVEAFVIPTGSMATTLLGAHMRFTCKECGNQFDVEFRTPEAANGEDAEIPSRAAYEETYVDPATGRIAIDPRTNKPLTRLVDRSFDIYCPNCRYKVSREEATGAPVWYGDRILVLKYLYIPWISDPHRWDVVVFKTPTGPARSSTPLYTINYIKRLIGLPGEELMLLDGDVYVRNKNDKTWEIQAKPKYAQDALWRIIYDNDYRPRQINRTDNWTLPWVHDAGDGWDTGDAQKSKVFTFNNPTGVGHLRFDHTAIPNYNPARAPGGYFTDWLAYDVTMDQRNNAYGHGTDYPVYTVSDLKLSFSYLRKSGTGPLKVRMTKHDHEFDLEFLPDHLRLTHRAPGQRQDEEIPAIAAINPAAFAGPIRVDFSNVDYQVSVRINDQLAFQTTAEKGKPGYYQPNVADLESRYSIHSKSPFDPPSVKLDASNQEMAISHISLWRDVYYTPEDNYGHPITHARPDAPVVLKKDPGEYFVMGDNSAASFDARFWTESVELPEEDVSAQPGRVPARFMLGRAFFVYWPAGYRPLNSAPALVPNFGDMRLIH